MIQRVQSLFLLGVTICMVSTLFFPIWQKLDLSNQSGAVLNALYTEIHQIDQEVERQYFPALTVGILAMIGSLVALIEIFQYRNRLSQIKLGALNSLIMAGVLGFSVYFTFRLEQLLPSEQEGSYEIGMYLPAIGLIFNLLANRFIRRDESLVRSVDRIR